MFRAENLQFAYPAQGTPYAFSFEAVQGEVTAISGPSGAGKSTLLDLLAGFLKPAQGQLLLEEQDLIPLEPEQRPVSLLLQTDNLFEHLSAEQNVALGWNASSKRKLDRAQLSAALLEVGLEGLGGQTAATLSGGQKQRVALARTLLRGKPVLLLDEPFSALDDATREAVRDLVGTLTKRHGWHTILVSHHSDDIAALASRHYRIVEKQLERV